MWKNINRRNDDDDASWVQNIVAPSRDCVGEQKAVDNKSSFSRGMEWKEQKNDERALIK